MHIYTYCIVMGKRPWALTAQAPKLECGRLHRERLNGSTIPAEGPTPDAKLAVGATKSTCIVASSVLCWGQPDSRESCIVLQSGPTHSLVAKFPHCLVIACSTEILCCRGRTLQTRPWMDVSLCANLWCLMSWPPKHIRTIAVMWAQRSYLRIHYAKF